MKKNIFAYFVVVSIFDCSLSAIAQDSIPKVTPQIIKEVVIRETKLEIVRDTVLLQPDSAINASLQILNAKVVSIDTRQELISQQQKVFEDKSEEHWMVLKWMIGTGIMLILAILMCFICLVIYTRQFIKGHSVNTDQGDKDKDKNENLNDKNSVQTAPTEQDSPVLTKPSLDAYNTSVYEFTTLNDHVANLRKKETKPLVLAMYRFLAMRTEDKAALLESIRSTQIPDDTMEQFVALVSRISDFLIHKKPIIDAWLYWEPKEGVASYESAVRMPEGLIFDESLDEDVLGDNIEGRQISMVHKMGFYFPGNTIKPYREKSVVSA